MDAATPPSHAKTDLSALAAELASLRDLWVTLSLSLTDFQFDSDPALRAAAESQTDQLLRACKSRFG